MSFVSYLSRERALGKQTAAESAHLFVNATLTLNFKPFLYICANVLRTFSFLLPQIISSLICNWSYHFSS